MRAVEDFPSLNSELSVVFPNSTLSLAASLFFADAEEPLAEDSDGIESIGTKTV